MRDPRQIIGKKRGTASDPDQAALHRN